MKPVIRQYFAFQFFFSLLIWLPVFYEFQKRIGLSDPEIFGIQSIYYVVFALLEIPTGFMADRIGLRHCLRFGAIILFGASLLPAIEPNYGGMLGHFLLIALSRSLISGASSAYIYEYLKKFDASFQYKQIEGAARAYSLLGRVVCWAAVGTLMEINIYLPYLLTALSSAIATYFAFRLPAFTPSLQLERMASSVANSVRQNFIEVARALLTSPLLLIIMFQGVALFVMVRVLQVNLYQPMLESKSFSVASYGLIMSLMTVFEAVGSYRPNLLSRWMSDLNAVFALSLVMALTIGLMPISNQVGAVACLCVFALVSGISFPIQKQLVNDAIPTSQYRATLISIESIIDRSICAIAASFIGGYLAAGRLNEFLYLSAGLTAASMILLSVLVRAARRRSAKPRQVG